MSSVPPPLQGRRILVTGAATGIGAAAVRVLTQAGAEIAATYHQTPPPEDLTATWLQCDARDADAVSATVQQAAEHLGGLDVLVNAAGLWQAGVPGYISPDDISFLLDTNVKATILTNQAAYTVMKDQDPKGGKIINFGSSEAIMGSPVSAVYAATKGAVQAGPDPPPRLGAPTRYRQRAGAGGQDTRVRPIPRFPRPGSRRPHRPADANDDPDRRVAGRPRARCRSDAGFFGRTWLELHHRATARRRRRLDDGGRLTAIHA